MSFTGGQTMSGYDIHGSFGRAMATFSVVLGLAAATRADAPTQEDLEARYQEEQRAQLEAYFDRRLEASYAERAKSWNRDFSNAAAYEKSVAIWRRRFADYLGGMNYNPAPLAAREELIRETDTHVARRVWIPAFDDV